MSWIRLVRDENPAGSFDGTPVYDGVCEESSDLTAEQNNGWVEYGGGRKVLGVGSMILCLETKTCNIKTSDGSWAEIGGGGGSASEEEEDEETDSSASPQNDAEEEAAG